VRKVYVSGVRDLYKYKRSIQVEWRHQCNSRKLKDQRIPCIENTKLESKEVEECLDL
jgi:hypothetical protein